MKEVSLFVRDVEWTGEGIRDSLVFPHLIYHFDAEFRFLNSLITSSTWISCLSTHSLSESGYPFHLMRYCSLHLLPNCQESRIFSTLYSSSLSTKSRGGLA